MEKATEAGAGEPAAKAEAVEPAARADAVEPAARADAVEPAARADAVEPAAKAEAVRPTANGGAIRERTVTVASTDPRKALADIARLRAEGVRRARFRRASQAALVLGMLMAALLYPRFREHSLASAPAEAPALAVTAPRAALPEAPSAPVEEIAEPAAAPAMAAVEQEPSARCETDFQARAWRGAIEACSAAFEAAASPELAMRIAHAHFARGDVESAGTWASNALDLGTTDPDVYVLIGNAEDAAGRPRKALSAYRRYLELAPRGWHAARLRRLVNGKSAKRQAAL